MHPSSRSVLLALAVVLLALTRAAADRIELRTGEVLVGKILRHNEDEVSIRLATGGVLSFKWNAIRRVRKGTETYENSGELPPPVTPAERPSVKKKAAAPPGPRPSAGAAKATPREEPAGAPRSAVKEPPEPDDSAIIDEERGFAVAPPKGLVPRPESRSEVVPLAFVDPFTRATFTVSAYPSTDTVLQVKKSTLRSLTENFSAFRVLRDEKLVREGRESDPEAWVVEVESKVGTTSVRQLQVFTRTERCVVILSYSATVDSFLRHEDAFARSLLSFRTVPVAAEKPAPASPQG
jgi:hypothetical protein